ncbi:TCR/Tet family MFS transporter [Ciceribacter sp. L1K23]|uniref:TCR/Tet family MFS transporter n=1 Tax=Ciceribacter sp. L1K23 TaxID=2820276 RepID=UPI001B819C4C|nr:TCR/Tet family MFS transporter [Ciceribacter sp. L1K23]MBR0556919.1 TCR/Tet family MFS transporter [Ciceribacter sp. L1K23]
MKRSLTVIYAAIMLDSIGIGLIFPILPTLLKSVAGSAEVASLIGTMAALYAAMQFLFSPLLGMLSDRYGRRPILLLSMAGAVINYLFLAFAPVLWMLFLGRAIAGVTSANMAVAGAYIVDVSAESERAKRFGVVSAMFGAGFILGPVVGGALGDHWLRLPFLAAAALNGINLLLAFVFLPESRAQDTQPIRLASLNPLRPLEWAIAEKNLKPFLLLFFIFSATGEAYGTCWALWGQDSFHWNGLWIGLSLGTFGICQTAAQAFLPGPAIRWFGERRTVLFGIFGVSVALLLMALASHGWMVFALMPLFALGGIGAPTLQSLATRQVDNDRQGQLQGVLASIVSLASIVGPLIFSTAYLAIRNQWPGGIWLLVIVFYAIAAVIVCLLRFGQPQALQTTADRP